MVEQAPRNRSAVTKFVGDVFSTEKKIGDLNGKWAVMLKVVVLMGTILLPVLLTWAVWVTTSIFSAQHHEADTTDFRTRIVKIEKVLSVTPEQINHIQADADSLRKDVKDLRSANTLEHREVADQLNEKTLDISIQLTKIQTQIESIPKKQ